MKKQLAAILLSTSLLMPIGAQAGFFSSIVDGFTSVSNNIIDGATETSVSMLDLFGALADDIGEMADRILVMADNIGIMADRILIMADKIGEMADRIVATEELLADLTLDLANVASDVGSIKTGGTTTTGGASTLLISQNYQSHLYYNQTPNFSLSESSSEYIVYVSSTLTMDSNTISVVVRNNAELANHWQQLQSLANNYKIYVAVKSINGNNISSLSNVLTYTTSY